MVMPLAGTGLGRALVTASDLPASGRPGEPAERAEPAEPDQPATSERIPRDCAAVERAGRLDFAAAPIQLRGEWTV
jgi:hypothetical protein